MSMIIEPVATTRPISIAPFMVKPIADGVMRRLVVPAAVMGPRPTEIDALWVREGFTVLGKQPSGPNISIRYAGHLPRVNVPWPRARKKLAAGVLDAGAMPVTMSRTTLLLDEVRICALDEVTQDEALTAGLTGGADGYGVIGYPFLMPFNGSTPALHWLLSELYGRDREVARSDPMAVISFRSLSRNISLLAVGEVGA